MLEQVGTKFKTIELDHHISELVAKGFTIVKEVETKERRITGY